MKPPLAVLFLLALATPSLHAASPSALEAVARLPKEAAGRLARVEARGGRPTPDSWHLLVHDPAEPAGLREFVVVGEEIVASRTVSQFAERLAPEDVLDLEKISVDSDEAAAQARSFALANNLVIASLNYRLLREGAGAAPLWHIESLDASGRVVGTLRLTATRGTIVTREGFPIEPKPEGQETSALTVYAPSDIAPETALTDMVEPTPAPKRTVRRNREPEPKGGIHKVGNTLKKFFTGRD